ncbi:hypothetical protein JCM1840_003405, partial [Sporobolomyces johnsonii]
YGTSAALRFVRYVDPSLSCDLYADKPWALSPLFATLQSMSAKKVPASSPLAPFTPSSFPEDLTPLLSDPTLKSNPPARRSYFSQASHRRALTIPGRTLVVRGDFAHGFVDFKTLALALPGGLSFSLARYWNGEPVVFSCQRRSDGETFFVVTFELVEDDEDEGEGEGEGKGEANAKETSEPEKAGQSSDVD